MTSGFDHSTIRPGLRPRGHNKTIANDPAADAHGFFVVAGTVEASAGGHTSRGGDEAGRYGNVGIDEHADQRPSPGKSSDPSVLATPGPPSAGRLSPDESSGPPVRRAMSS